MAAVGGTLCPLDASTQEKWRSWLTGGGRRQTSPTVHPSSASAALGAVVMGFEGERLGQLAPQIS